VLAVHKVLTVAITAVTDFLITAGTAYTVAASAGETMPTTAQIIAILVGGVVQAARGVQKTLAPPP